MPSGREPGEIAMRRRASGAADAWAPGWEDLVGLALAVATATWAVLAAGSRADPGPVVGLLAASALAFAAARALASVGAWLVPAAVVLAAGALALLAGPDVASHEPLSGPLGYVNADAAFYLQATVAALALFSLVRAGGARVAAVAAALAFAMVPVLKDSAAAYLLLGLVGLPFLPHGLLGARVRVAVCGALVAAAVAFTAVLGAAPQGPVARQVLDTPLGLALSERRVVLWHEALETMTAWPWTGVGAGRFREFSPTARADEDAAWAHNEFLQRGAEEGVPGLLLFTGLFAWGFWRLWSVRRPGRLVVLAAIGLAAVGVQASIDYILHFPPVALAAAALLGVATSRRDVAARDGTVGEGMGDDA